MVNESVNYHLEQATSHLEMALMKSQSMLQSNEDHNDLSQTWSYFLTYLLGNVNRNEPATLISSNEQQIL